MKLFKIIFLSLLFILVGCQKMISNSEDVSNAPDWAEVILDRSENLNSLIGSWDYNSITAYNNSDCSGDNIEYEYSGSVIYGEKEAKRSYNSVYYYSDFSEKIDSYKKIDFESDCKLKNGLVSSTGNCTISDEESLEYYLVEGNGYCEVYSKGKKKISYCGSIDIKDNTAVITFSWNSDTSKWEDSGCKKIKLSLSDI